MPRGWWILLAVCAVLSVLASCTVGPWALGLGDVVTAVGGAAGLLDASQLPEAVRAVVVDLRLARAVLALGVGAALAMAGTTFQAVLQNPLADPFTLGVSAGAALGATLVLGLGITSDSLGPMAALAGGWTADLRLSALPVAALAGGLATLAAVLVLGRQAGGSGGLSRETLVLAGVVVSSVLAACIALVKAVHEEAVGAMVFWIMGSLQGRGWGHLLLFLPFFVIGALVMARYARELDLLALGEEQALLLGVDVQKVRLLLLLGATLVTAAAVAVSGIIGFVGLVAPHAFRLWLRPRSRTLLAASALGGGILLVWSDVLARALLATDTGGMELPVGVITALLGGPFFCVLLGRRGRHPGRGQA
ncbi:FecCD family ABC transporter permease [Megalodesulfovibrio paquesii]